MPTVEERVSKLEIVLEEFIKSVTELSNAQRRTEIGLEKLANAQARTESGLERLANAQARTESGLERLANAQARTESGLERLANAQARTESGLERLANAQARTESELERLANAQARTEAELRAFKEESERDRKALHEEMKAFKDEMKDFKDEMKVFKDKMIAFREETREENKKMNKRWGEISNKLGTIVEDIIYPALRPVIKQYFGCEPIHMAMNIRRKRGELKDEYDAIVECEDEVFLVEVKATPKKEYIDDFKENKVKRFTELFPEYKEKNLILIFASLRLEEDTVNYLTQNRIYAMAYREWEYMDILNFDAMRQMFSH